MSVAIDHVVINARDTLDVALLQFEKLGFHLTPRGHHSLGTSNNLAIFSNDYLELLGVEPEKVASVKVREPFDHPLGLTGLVFKTQDSEALWNDLSARGVALEGSEPRAFFRPVQLPDGNVQDARFRTVRIAPELFQFGRVFFCHHLTPDLVWRPEWQTHENGATAIAEFAFVTPDPAETAKIFERAFGPRITETFEDGLKLRAGNASVLFLTASALARRYGVQAEALPSSQSRAIALTLRTSSIDRLLAVLDRNQVPYHYGIHGRVVVSPEHAAGVVLGFVGA